MAMLWCTNHTFGTLCFNVLHYLPVVKLLPTIVSGHVMLRERGHFLEKITALFLNSKQNEVEKRGLDIGNQVEIGISL